jgi:uncharacterized protein (DUF1810 family)
LAKAATASAFGSVRAEAQGRNRRDVISRQLRRHGECRRQVHNIGHRGFIRDIFGRRDMRFVIAILKPIDAEQ